MVANDAGRVHRQRHDPRRDRRRRDRRRPDQPLLRRPGGRRRGPRLPGRGLLPARRPRLAAAADQHRRARVVASARTEAFDFVRSLLSRDGQELLHLRPRRSTRSPTARGPTRRWRCPLAEIPAPEVDLTDIGEIAGDDRADAGDGGALMSARRAAELGARARPAPAAAGARRRRPLAARRGLSSAPRCSCRPPTSRSSSPATSARRSRSRSTRAPRRCWRGRAGLATAVTAASIAIALPLAWLTVRTDLPGRRLWATLCALPLVIPTYVGAYLFVAALGPNGMLRTRSGSSRLPVDLRLLRRLAGADAVHLPARPAAGPRGAQAPRPAARGRRAGDGPRTAGDLSQRSSCRSSGRRSRSAACSSRCS